MTRISASKLSNFGLEHFEELPVHISNTWYNVEHQGPHLPMSFTLVMRKG